MSSTSPRRLRTAQTPGSRSAGPRLAGVALVAASLALALPSSSGADQALVNWAADPYGRVVDVTFDEPVALVAPWDRFRFSVDIVQPLTRESGAFLSDLDGDGVRDLFLASFNGSLLFFPGIAAQERLFGAGTLLRHTTSEAGENPFLFDWGGTFVAGAVGDLDGDGVREVVVGPEVYRNAAAAPAVLLEHVYSIPRCGGPFDPTVSLGDLDGDGDLDAVMTSNYFAGDACIRWNESSPGAFAFTTELLADTPMGWQPDNRLCLGDLNGDGLLDLAGAAGICFNTGTATAPAWDVFNPSPWNVTGRPLWHSSDDLGTDLFLVDADADGDLDLYVSGAEATVWQALYYLNEGTATEHHLAYMGPVVARSSPVSTVHRGSDQMTFTIGDTRATAADVDADGRVDVTVGGALRPAGAAILWNRVLGSTFLTYPDLHTWPELARVDSRCGGSDTEAPDALCRPPSEIVAWRDVDGDGAVDALLGHDYLLQDGLSYFASSGGWPFSLDNLPWPYGSPEPLVTTGSGSPVDGGGVTFVDVDLDGKVDLVAGQEDGTLLWYRNTAASGMTLSDPVALTDSASTPIDVGGYANPTAVDLDGDGDLDLLVAVYDGVQGLVHKVLAVTPGQANGYVDSGLLAVAGQDPFAMGYCSLFAIDYDSDSLVDLLASASDTNSVLLLRNTGTVQEPAFTVEPLLVSQTSAAHLELLDGDTVRLYFALPVVTGQTTLTYYLVPTAGDPISGSLPVRSQPRLRRAQGRLAPGP
jgi:large repetitive protein